MSWWKEHVSNDTNALLKHLIDIKQHLEKLDTKLSYFSFLKNIIIGFSIVYILIFFMLKFEDNILFTLGAFVSNIYSIIVIIITVGCSYVVQHFQSLRQKEGNRYQKLRIEMIDHLKSTWYINEHSSIRDAISTYLEGYGINIRSKNN